MEFRVGDERVTGRWYKVTGDCLVEGWSGICGVGCEGGWKGVGVEWEGRSWGYTWIEGAVWMTDRIIPR